VNDNPDNEDPGVPPNGEPGDDPPPMEPGAPDGVAGADGVDDGQLGVLLDEDPPGDYPPPPGPPPPPGENPPPTIEM
jgi:hypothetical protein